LECPHIPQISYDQFGKRLMERTPEGRFPWFVTIELTARCNLNCVHCYINRSANDREAEKRELTTEEFYRILDEIAGEGCFGVLFTGGEPLLRQDFLDIYTYTKKKGLLVTLFTNGTTVTPELADYLEEWPPRSVEVTLYGRTEDTYEKVTRVPGSYARCMTGIELLLARRIAPKLKTMALTVNSHELWDMKAFAKQYGLEFRFDPNVNKRLDGGATPCRYRLAPEETVALDFADKERWLALRDYCIKDMGKKPAFPERLYWCGAGSSGFHVDPYGMMSLCISSRVPSYDLRSGSIRQGWHEFIPEVLSRTRKRQTSCESCTLSLMCDQCPGWAQLEEGDQETPVDFLCRVAHARAELLGIGPGSRDDSLNEESHETSIH
jgi:radical SAM protein with 4Fe4S-binding SPASM domain